jgi:hypothetical protein
MFLYQGLEHLGHLIIYKKTVNPDPHVEKGSKFRFALKMQIRKLCQKERKRMTKMPSEHKILKGHFFTGRIF